MNVSQTSIKRVALVLLAAAVVAPAALGNSGQPVAGNSHLADLTAMAKRYRATASTTARNQPATRHLADLTAMAGRYRATASTTAAITGNSHLADLTAMEKAYRAQISRTAPVTGNSHLTDLTAMANSSHAAAAVQPAAATIEQLQLGRRGHRRHERFRSGNRPRGHPPVRPPPQAERAGRRSTHDGLDGRSIRNGALSTTPT